MNGKRAEAVCADVADQRSLPKIVLADCAVMSLIAGLQPAQRVDLALSAARVCVCLLGHCCRTTYVGR